MTDAVSQSKMLLAHFLAGGTMTALEADRAPFWITQFHTRLFELRQQGYVFHCAWEKNPNTGKRYKRYALAQEGAAVQGEAV